MSTRAPDRGLLVASVLGRDPDLVDRACSRLAAELGPLLHATPPLPFPWTNYYGDELGEQPARRIVALDRWEDTSALPDLKRACCRLEVVLGRPGGSRQVNLDPGILGVDQLVLASTKPRGHRIHLGRGIHGELTLVLGEDGLEPLPWTYPDYRSAELRAVFDRLRQLVLERRRGERS